MYCSILKFYIIYKLQNSKYINLLIYCSRNDKKDAEPPVKKDEDEPKLDNGKEGSSSPYKEEKKL